MKKYYPWDDLLREFEQGPDQLTQLVEDLSEELLDSSLDDESWTIRQIVHHIIDGDEIWKGFLKQALGNNDQPFNLFWYWDLSQDDWAEIWQYSERPITPSLKLLRANRYQVLSLLSVIDKPWEQKLEIHFPGGVNEVWTIHDALNMNTIHLQGHLEDIQAILNHINYYLR